MTVLYPAEDYDATTDDIAFPQEWFRALKWELMREITPAGVEWTSLMKEQYRDATAIARQLNPENSVLFFQSAT